MLLILVAVLLVLALGGGFWASPNYGPWGFSPLALILLIVVILLLTGNLHT
jgi:hypothetical protein